MRKHTNLRRDTICTYFDSIRGAIGCTHSAIDNIFEKALEKHRVNHIDRYEPDFREEWLAQQRQDVFTQVEAARTVGKNEVDGYFTLIRDELNDWIRQPIGAELAAQLDSYSRFGTLSPSVMEIEALQESAAGSYLGAKVVDGIARSFGIFNTGFRQIEALMQSLVVAQADVHSALDNYFGKMGANRKYPGQDYMPLEPEKMLLVPYAEHFLDEGANTSFSRIATELNDLTTDSFELLPSKRSEIDKLFLETEGESRIDVAKRLIEQNDRFSILLPKYDKQLYQSALDAIAEERSATAREKMKQFEVSKAEAARASRESVRAEAKAHHLI